MWWKILVVVALYLVFRWIRVYNRAKEACKSPMLGFNWGDSISTIKSITKKIRLKYQTHDSSAEWIMFNGAFPYMPGCYGSYTFHLSNGKLNGITIMLPSANYKAAKLSLDLRYGESWNEGSNRATWVFNQTMVVAFRGDSTYLQIRYQNISNSQAPNELLEKEEEGLIAAFEHIDKELVYRTA